MRGTYVRQTWGPKPDLYAPRSYRRPCSYEAFVPDSLGQPEIRIPGELAATISEAETRIAALNSGPPGYLAPLAHLLLRTESIASSKVEGLQADARSLARADVNLEAGRSVGRQVMEILASIDAMELCIERAAGGRALDVADLCEVHGALMKDVAPKMAGHIREVQNWIGGNDYNPCGADFVPPPPEHLDRLLADLCGFWSDDSLSPLVQAAIAHAQFETIHPFDDGNGRTGRAVIQVILRRSGLAPLYVPPISVMLAKHKDTYIRGLTLFREGDLEGWLATFADAAASAAQLAQRYTRRVAELQEHWRESLRAADSVPRADAAAWTIIDTLPAHPLVTVPVAMAATGRTRPAIANGLQQLESVGVVEVVSGSTKNRSWEAVGLLDLIVGLEEGAPI